MKLARLISSLKLKAVSRIQAAKFGKIDYGVVKVAFMVAALDGEVSDDELKALDALLKKCRGYTKEAAAKALDEAMRSAGYLLLLGRRAKETTLLRAFLAEAGGGVAQSWNRGASPMSSCSSERRARRWARVIRSAHLGRRRAGDGLCCNFENNKEKVLCVKN